MKVMLSSSLALLAILVPALCWPTNEDYVFHQSSYSYPEVEMDSFLSEQQKPPEGVQEEFDAFYNADLQG